MDAAKDCVRAGQSEIIGVRADHQEAGRGRLGRAWSAPAGTCLLVTYISRFPLVADLRSFAFAAPVATARALESVCGIRPGIKWPNDLVANGKKLAGILIENFWTRERPSHGAVLVGIGVNLNVESFPPGLADSATSVLLETGRECCISALEAA